MILCHRSYWKNYFESTDGVVWVVDSADSRRLQDCERELRALLQEERLAGATLLVLANKCDLPGALPAADVTLALGLPDVRSHHWRVLACSAVTGDSLLEAVDWMLDDIASRIFTLD